MSVTVFGMYACISELSILNVNHFIFFCDGLLQLGNFLRTDDKEDKDCGNETADAKAENGDAKQKCQNFLGEYDGFCEEHQANQQEHTAFSSHAEEILYDPDDNVFSVLEVHRVKLLLKIFGQFAHVYIL